jgi:hypothetical protein
MRTAELFDVRPLGKGLKQKDALAKRSFLQSKPSEWSEKYEK